MLGLCKALVISSLFLSKFEWGLRVYGSVATFMENLGRFTNWFVPDAHPKKDMQYNGKLAMFFFLLEAALSGT